MELIDLYDENRKLLEEKVERNSKIQKGKYYVTVVIFIENLKGELLLQKRHIKKDGKWATTGGHPFSGETSKQGIIREVKEELSIDISKENIKLIKTLKSKDDFIDIYYLSKNINIKEIKIQKEELTEVKWASLEEINSMIITNKFSKSHKLFLKYLNKT